MLRLRRNISISFYLSHLVLTRLTRPAFCMARGNTRFWIPRSVTSLDPVISRYWRTVQFCPRMERIWLSQTPWRTTWRSFFIFSAGNNEYLAPGGKYILEKRNILNTKVERRFPSLMIYSFIQRTTLHPISALSRHFGLAPKGYI